VDVRLIETEGVLYALALGLKVWLPQGEGVSEGEEEGDNTPLPEEIGVVQGEGERVVLWEGLGNSVVETEEER
jgi:hypothetical protein